jgi:prepilin-type processing-associated H-X9-DG protein
MYEINKYTPAAKFVHWNHAVTPYVKNNAVFRCPTSKATEELRAPSITDINDRIITRRDTSYAYNYSHVNDVPTQLDNSPTSTQMQGSIESKIVFDSKTVLNYDRPWQEEQYDDGSIKLIDPESLTPSCGASIAPTTMHSGGANYSFADGHVKWMTPSQMGEMKCADKIQ